MTAEYKWGPRQLSNIRWLKTSSARVPAGLMHRDAPTESRIPEAYDWRVARWAPEEFIAYLPADMPEAEALDAAKTLILLRLKERE